MRNTKKIFAIIMVAVMALAIMMVMSSCETDHTHEISRVEEVSAGCETEGVKSHFKCSGCDKLFVDVKGSKEITRDELVIAPLGHAESFIPGTPATCTEAGISDGKTCSVCKKVLVEQVELLPTDHTKEVWEGFAATCTSNGLTDGERCATCGLIFATREIIPATDHDWDEGVGTAPTCTAGGVMTFTCKNDSTHTKTEELPALGHDYDEGSVTTAPNCTLNGVKTFTCKNDSTHTITEELPALGHDYDEGSVTTAPTCTLDGVKTFTCKNDSTHTKTEAVPALGHDYDEGNVTTAPTCTLDGVKTFTCKNDSTHTYTEAVPALGHDYDEGSVTTAPTCTMEGVKTFTCKNDPTHTYTEKLPVVDHSAQKVAAVASDCINPGNIEYWRCSVCAKLFADETCINEITDADIIVAAKGHSLVLAATGAKTQYEIGESFDRDNLVVKLCCGNCDYEEAVTSYTLSKEADLQATDGQVIISCVKGETTYTATYVITVKHTHNMTFFAAKSATCETNGNVEYYFCSVCSNAYSTEAGNDADLIQPDSIVISALGHDYDEGNVTTAPTCTLDGVKTFTCKNDSAHTYTETLPALGHDYDEGSVTTAPTCTSDGVKTFTCKNDSAHAYTEAVPAIGHSWSEITYTWSADNKSCTASKVCANDDSHSIRETVDAVVESTAVGCENDGFAIYTATFTNDIFATQTKSETYAATGHNFENGACKNNCGSYYLTLNNATLENNAGVLVAGETNVYIVKAGTELVIKANADPKGKIFVGFDKNSTDNRVEQTKLSPVLTVKMDSNPVTYTAVYNADLYISATNDKNALVSTGWGSGKYTEGSQSGVSSSMFKSGDKYTQYGYTGYTFTINSNVAVSDELIQNITRCNVKTLNNSDRMQRIAKVIFKNNGEFGVTVELAFFRLGYFASTDSVYVGAGETVIAYLELPMFVSDTSSALLGSFTVHGVDAGAEGSVALDVAVGAAKKYESGKNDVLSTEDADFVNFVTESTTGMGTVDHKSHSDGDSKYFDNIGALHWAYTANMFASSAYRYIGANAVALTYADGDEITVYVKLINYANTMGMLDNEFEIFVIQGTKDSYVELVRETVKLSEENGEMVVKLTFKPTNANGTIYFGAIKHKSVAEAEANAAGVATSKYNYNVVMQYAYNNPFGEVDATFTQSDN